MTVRTSLSHPLHIATVHSHPNHGPIGITFCPGKTQISAMSGQWERDLSIDLDAVRDWGAVAVITLVEDHELKTLKVEGMGSAVQARHMDWHHLPIPDVQPPGPEFERQWNRVSAGLRAQISSGFGVVVHCKGGLGRAGTIAARLLVELGMAPQDAVKQVRAARPGAIETSAQQAHVMGCKSIPEAKPATDFASVRDRARGALLGLAVGDAIGTTLEFERRDVQPRLTNMIGGGPFRLQAGQWTDDTAMALALADSLALHPHLDEADLMGRFVDWHENGTYSCTGRCFDIGITTRQALARWKTTGNPIAGDTDSMSAGNGSLMRLSPVAIRHFRDRDRLRDVAARQSRTTHAAEEAVEACVFYAERLADAIVGASRADLLGGRTGMLIGKVGDIRAGGWRGRRRDQVRGTGYVVQSLEASLWCVGSTPDYSAAILKAANLGDDADTTAAITGQLAGAIDGAMAIPSAWRDRVAWGAQIQEKADTLLGPEK